MNIELDFPNDTRLCSKIFQQGQSGVHCLDCMKDQAAIYCMPCFENSNHKGHRIIIKKHAMGCCDCGDEQAVKPQSFCTKHLGKQLKIEIKKQVQQQFVAMQTLVLKELLDNDNQNQCSLFQYLNKLNQKSKVSASYCYLIYKVLKQNYNQEINIMSALFRKTKRGQILHNLCISLSQQYEFKKFCTIEFVRNYKYIIGQQQIHILSIQLFSGQGLTVNMLQNTQVRLSMKGIQKLNPTLLLRYITDIHSCNKFQKSSLAFWKLSPQSYFQLYDFSTQQFPQNITLNKIQKIVLQLILIKSMRYIKKQKAILQNLFIYKPNKSFIYNVSTRSCNIVYYYISKLVSPSQYDQSILRLNFFKYIWSSITQHMKTQAKGRCHPDKMQAANLYSLSALGFIDHITQRTLINQGSQIPYQHSVQNIGQLKRFLLRIFSILTDYTPQILILLQSESQINQKLIQLQRLKIRHLLSANKLSIDKVLKLMNPYQIDSYQEFIKKQLFEVSKLEGKIVVPIQPVQIPDPFIFSYNYQKFLQIRNFLKDLYLSVGINYIDQSLLKKIQPIFKKILLKSKIIQINTSDQQNCIQLRQVLCFLVKLNSIYRQSTLQQTFLNNFIKQFAAKYNLIQFLKKLPFELVIQKKKQKKLKDTMNQQKKAIIKQRKQKLIKKAKNAQEAILQGYNQQSQKICLICRQPLKEQKFYGSIIFFSNSNIWFLSQIDRTIPISQLHQILNRKSTGFSITTCRHQFHGSCFDSLVNLQSFKSCPMCRSWSNFLLPDQQIQIQEKQLKQMAVVLSSISYQKLQYTMCNTIALMCLQYMSNTQQYQKTSLTIATRVCNLFKKMAKDIFSKQQIDNLNKYYYSCNKQDNTDSFKRLAINFLIDIQTQKIQQTINLKIINRILCKQITLSSAIKFPQKKFIMELPNSLKQFQSHYADSKCHNCTKYIGINAKQLCLCLLCGEIICNVQCDIITFLSKVQGQLNKHSMSYHGGSSVFVGISTLFVYVIVHPKNTMSQALYIDEFKNSYKGKVEIRDQYFLDQQKLNKIQRLIRKGLVYELIIQKQNQGEKYKLAIF